MQSLHWSTCRIYILKYIDTPQKLDSHIQPISHSSNVSGTQCVKQNEKYGGSSALRRSRLKSYSLIVGVKNLLKQVQVTGPRGSLSPNSILHSVGMFSVAGSA